MIYKVGFTMLKKRVEAGILESIILGMEVILAIIVLFVFIKASQVAPSLFIVVIEMQLITLMAILGLTFALVRVWSHHEPENEHPVTKLGQNAEITLLAVMGILGIVAGWLLLFAKKIQLLDPMLALVEIQLVIFIAITGLVFVCVKIWEQHTVPDYTHKVKKVKSAKKSSRKKK
jgi:Co/Zn/Cd efflux system component